jgi:hypothetical protein
MKHTVLLLTFISAFAALAQQHSTVPVVIGDEAYPAFDSGPGDCYNPARTAASNFGMLPYMRAQDSGQTPAILHYCKYAWDAGG